MARRIFIVDAFIVDGNGTFNRLSNEYPKKFDSNQFASSGDNAVEVARLRAEADFYTVWAGYCLRDDRQKQTVVLYADDGQLLARKTRGEYPAPVAAEPEA